MLTIRLRCEGVSPGDHPVKTELERLSLYEGKLKRYMYMSRGQRQSMRDISEGEAVRSRDLEHRNAKKKRKYQSSEKQYVRAAAQENHTGTVLRTYSHGLGNVTGYMADCSALLQGLQDAASNGWLIAWSESDSVAAVEAFNNGNVPWQLKGDSKVVKTKMQQIRITSTWREVNFSSDELANKGARLFEGNMESHVGRPQFLNKIEEPMKEYFRLC
ncbi:hypothetical protein GIB67_011293 [Kingdonia uniflora]|uniref:Nuclear nucleic acid-binding protein C1D n=1 Tax=Kingdonia uniflora TaxID=39325 RepID=A0A7J7MP07_9MAGN|nr:hypothetical protein GIB67_011293 [Kingdonia uniflora]